MNKSAMVHLRDFVLDTQGRGQKFSNVFRDTKPLTLCPLSESATLSMLEQIMFFARAG